MKNASQALGILGEELAVRHLVRSGYQVITRNFECLFGEIDVIAREKDTLVFVEVKSRRSLSAGIPGESVHGLKQVQIVRSAQYYLKRFSIPDTPCRFDVVSITFREGEDASLEIIRDAFGERR